MKKLIAVVLLAACTVHAATTSEVLDTMDKYAHTVKVESTTLSDTTTTIHTMHNVHGDASPALVLEGLWLIERGTEIKTAYEDEVLYAYFDGNKAKVAKLITEEKESE